MNSSLPFRPRASLLNRLTWSGVLSLGLWSMGSSTLAVLSASAQTVPSSVLNAYTLLDQGLVNQAIARFERLLQQMPESLEARLGLAIAYRRAGRDADAFQAYQRVLAVDPNNRLALLSLGTLGGFRPEWHDRGIAALTSLIQRNAEDQEARTQRALLHLYEGNFDAAVADYEQVLQKDPAPEAILGAAQAYGYQGNFAQSLALFDRYRQTGKPLQGDPVTAYARVLRLTGEPADAAQVLETQLRQQPRLTPVTIRMRAELALNYAALQRFDRASSILAPLRGRADSRMILGRTLIAIGKTADREAFLDEGIALFQSVLAEPEATTAMRREIADVLAGIPQSQAIALTIYQQLGLAQPDDRGLQTQIAVLEHANGKLSEADLLTRLTQLLQTLPPEPNQQQKIAQALIEIKQPNPLLLPLYENLVRSGVSEPMLYFRIAQMYLRQGKYDTARSVLSTYQQAAARDNTTANQKAAGELLLAAIDQRQGNLETSVRRYQAILDSQPDDQAILAGALQGLAGVRQAQGDLREALRLYNQAVALNPQDPAKQLGQASLQYQANLLPRSEAEALLRRWLTSQPLTETPPELYSLVAALPANPAYEMLYRTLVQADPTQIAVQYRLAEVMAKQNETTAMAYVDQIVASNPEDLNVYFLKGYIAQKIDDLDEAAAAYEEILKREPQNVNALSALGGVRFQQRRYYAAVDLYSQVLALQPDHTIARGALSSLEGVLKRNLPALRQAQQMRQAEEEVMPALSPAPAALPSAEFQPQGDTPLPWERRS